MGEIREWGSLDSQTPRLVGREMKKRKGARGWRPGVQGTLAPGERQGPAGGCLGSGSGGKEAWRGGTPAVGSGGQERTGRGSGDAGWAEGKGHMDSPAAAYSPLPPVGAPSRALIGVAAAAGRVSAASLRDATPSNCGRDRRYAAASCPGARPGPPRPRPALRPPAARGH